MLQFLAYFLHNSTCLLNKKPCSLLLQHHGGLQLVAMEYTQQEQHRRKPLHYTLPGKPSQDRFIAFTLLITAPMWTRKFGSCGLVWVLLTCTITILVSENTFKIYLKLLMYLIWISARTILSSSSKSRTAIWVGLAQLKCRENSYSVASLSNYQLSKSLLKNCRMLYSAPQWAALR